MNKKTYIYSMSSLLQIDTPYLCHIDLKISSLTAVTYCRLELQPVVTKIPKCALAHMRINTLKTVLALNHTDVGHDSWLHEELAKLRFQLNKQLKEMELKLETNMTELIENMQHKINTRMQTNAEEEELFVGARHTPTERIGMSDGYV